MFAEAARSEDVDSRTLRLARTEVMYTSESARFGTCQRQWDTHGDQLESNFLCRGGWDGRVDPDGLGEGFGYRLTGDEALWMGGPGLVEQSLPAGDDFVSPPEVDLLGGQHRDTAVAMLGIVPAEE